MKKNKQISVQIISLLLFLAFNGFNTHAMWIDVNEPGISKDKKNLPNWHDAKWEKGELRLVQQTEFSKTYQWLPTGTNVSEASWSTSGTESSESSWIKNTKSHNKETVNKKIIKK